MPVNSDKLILKAPEPPQPRTYFLGALIDKNKPPFFYKHTWVLEIILCLAFIIILLATAFVIQHAVSQL